MFQNKYIAVFVTTIVLGITFYLWNKWNDRIPSIDKYVPFNFVDRAKVKMICKYWLRKSLSSPEISSHCLVDIVLKYYPSSEMLEWDVHRKHNSLELSDDGKQFTVHVGSGYIFSEGHIAVASKKIFSSDTISFIRWKVTLLKRSGQTIKFTMGYVDASFIDAFDVNKYVGSLHQAALYVNEGHEERDAWRVMKDDVERIGRDETKAITADYRYYQINPGDTFEMCFDFKARECKVERESIQRRRRYLVDSMLISADLPGSIYLALSVAGRECSFKTTLFEC